jgi:hypothetical protein
MANITAIRYRCRQKKEHKIPTRNECGPKAFFVKTYFLIGRQGSIGDSAETIERHKMIVRQLCGPTIVDLTHRSSNGQYATRFNAMALTMIKSDDLDPIKTIKRPRWAGRQILSPRE